MEIDNHTYIKRNFGPVYDANSRILILGSFPSVKSKEAAFFYGHPQNRFWKIMGALLKCEIPNDIPEIYCNGNTSYSLFMKYLFPICHRTPVKLPSTSPANAAWSIDRLTKEWSIIINHRNE